MADPTDNTESGPVTTPTDADIQSELASSPTTGDDYSYSFTPTGGPSVGAAADQGITFTAKDPDHPANAVPTPVETGGKASVEGTYRGLDPTLLKVNQASGSRADRLAAQDTAAEMPVFQQASEGYQRVADERRAALLDQARIEHEHYARDMDMQAGLQHVNETFAKAQAEAWTESKALQAKYLQQYDNDLAGVRVLASQSGDPMGRMSGGQAVGLIGAEFAQGFLAARGINIDVSGQVDRWVNREIQQHQQDVENQRGVAKDTYHLYELARQQSSDDYEARERYRGMVLEGLKSQIAVEASRFQSQLATSNAVTKIADIDQDLTTLKFGLGEKFFNTQLQNRVERNHEAASQAANSIAMIHARAALADAEARKAAALAKTGVAVPISDPTDHLVKWEMDPKDEKGLETARKARASFQEVYTKVKNAQKFAQDHASQLDMSGMGAIDNYDENRREYKAMVLNIATAKAHSVFGSNSTDQEQEKIMAQMPYDKWLQSGSNGKIWEDYLNNERLEFQSNMDSFAKPRARDAWVPDSSNTAAPGVANDYLNMHAQGGPETLPGSDAVARVGAKDTNADRAPASAFFQKYGTPDRPGEALGGGDKSEAGNYHQLEEAARVALDPDQYVSGFALDRHNPERLKQRTDQLKEDAVRAIERFKLDSDDHGLRDYADKLLEGIDSDPVRTLKLLTRTSTWEMPGSEPATLPAMGPYVVPGGK